MQLFWTMTMTLTTQHSTSLQTFHYQPLDLSKPSLRLIELSHLGNDGVIVCKIRHAKITEAYIALSYTWGPVNPCHEIKLIDQDNQKEGIFQIRSNLHSFLLRAVAFETGTLFWTDAICIDQQNIQERNHQVRQMGSIYRNAKEVRVWLGEDLRTGKILSAMSTISYKGDLRIVDLFDEQLCPPEFRSTFERENRAGLLKNEYWSRTWIVQEIMLAARITVQSADGHTLWSNLAGLYAPLRDQQSPFMQRLLGRWRTDESSDASGVPQQYGIGFLLSTFGETKCADIRDHLYGLLALVVDGDTLEVDYAESPERLLVRATTTLNLDAGDLQPLLPALNFDAKSLFAGSGIDPSDLWMTQKVLSQIRDVLDTKTAFPACSTEATGPCDWSRTGLGKPCSMCHDGTKRICEMPECLYDWQTQVRKLIQQDIQVPGTFSVNYRSHFKEWLCSTWPKFLAGPHSLDDDHCEQCFACHIKRRIQLRRDEWAHIEQSLQESSTGHQLPSLNNWLGAQSQPRLRTRRAAKPLKLGPPPPEGPKLATEHTKLWKELFKGTPRVDGWQ